MRLTTTQIRIAVEDLEATLDAYSHLPVEFQMIAALDWAESYQHVGVRHDAR